MVYFWWNVFSEWRHTIAGTYLSMKMASRYLLCTESPPMWGLSHLPKVWSSYSIRDSKVRAVGNRVRGRHFCQLSSTQPTAVCRRSPASSLCPSLADSLVPPSLLALKFNEPNLQKLSKQTALLTRQSFAFSAALARGVISSSSQTTARSVVSKRLKIDPEQTKQGRRALDTGCLETDL